MNSETEDGSAKMSVVTSQMLASKAAARWRRTYFNPADQTWRQTYQGDTKEKYDLLSALGDSPSPADVNAAIGNDSWTRLTCSACLDSSDRVVSVDVTGGEYSTHVCEKCVTKLSKFFQ